MMAHPGGLCSQALGSDFGSRGRCASSGTPGDVRRLAGLLRGESEVCGTGTSPYSGSSCAMPFGAWEPGDRGGSAPSAPSALAPWGPQSPLASARISPQLQIDALGERMGSVVVGLQRQCDTDRRASDRRFQQFERQLQGAIGRLEGDHVRDSDWREKFSLLQGSISGLVDESQAISRRVDGLDERLWSRTSGAEEISRQGGRELEMKLQAFERQARLATAAAEESQKRQAARQRRTENLMEDFAWRLQKEEERSGVQGPSGQSQAFEMRLQELSNEVGVSGDRLQNLEAQLEDAGIFEAAQAVAAEANFCDTVEEEGSEFDGGASIQGTLQVVERDHRTLERTIAQLEELSAGMASLRVKVEGQIQRQGSLADRLETAHVPALESLRNEFIEARARDLCEAQGRNAELDQKVDLALEALDLEGLVEKVERLAQRASGGEATAASLRREVHDLRGGIARNGVRRPVARGVISDAAMEFDSTIQEQLGAVADQLEALDELSNRVSDLSDRVFGLETAPLPAPPLPLFEPAETAATEPIGRRKAAPSSSKRDALQEIDRRLDERPPQESVVAGGAAREALASPAPLQRRLGALATSVASQGHGQVLTSGPSLEALSHTKPTTLLMNRPTRLKTPSPDLPPQRTSAPAPSPADSHQPSSSCPSPPLSASSVVSAPSDYLHQLAPSAAPPMEQLTAAAPPLGPQPPSRKQSVDSATSCEVGDGQDECVEPSPKDVLQGRCDVTVDVIPSPQHGRRPEPVSMEADEISGGSFSGRESFDDQESLGSGDGWDD